MMNICRLEGTGEGKERISNLEMEKRISDSEMEEVNA